MRRVTRLRNSLFANASKAEAFQTEKPRQMAGLFFHKL
jgi:hypothetical protein